MLSWGIQAEEANLHGGNNTLHELHAAPAPHAKEASCARAFKLCGSRYRRRSSDGNDTDKQSSSEAVATATKAGHIHRTEVNEVAKVHK